MVGAAWAAAGAVAVEEVVSLCEGQRPKKHYCVKARRSNFLCLPSVANFRMLVWRCVRVRNEEVNET